MPYTILYHPRVKEEDIESLDKNLKARVGDIRVVFKIMRNEVHILGIINRKLVYEKIEKRL